MNRVYIFRFILFIDMLLSAYKSVQDCYSNYSRIYSPAAVSRVKPRKKRPVRVLMCAGAAYILILFSGYIGSFTFSSSAFMRSTLRSTMRISTPITGVDKSSPTTPNSAPPMTSANTIQNGLSPIESPNTLGESTHASKPCISVSSIAEIFLPILSDDSFQFVEEEELPEGYRLGDIVL